MGSSGGETAQVRVMADVMQYDSENRAWVPCQGAGASNISLLQSLQNQTYRIIGQKAEDPNRISVNSSVISSLIYNEATPRFHQWRAQGTVYGLNFATAEQASEFACEMKLALEYVKGEREWPQLRVSAAPAPPPPAPMAHSAPRPPAPPMMRPPGPHGAAPPRPPGPPPGPAGPPPPGPPPPSSSAPSSAPASGDGGAGGDGRSALMDAIRGGGALKKTQGPPLREGPGNVKGDGEKKQAQSRAPPPSNRAAPGPMDFAAELQNRFNKKNTHQHPKPDPPQPQVNRVPPKIHGSNATSSSSTTNSNNTSTTATTQQSNNEIQRIIQEELAKMKDQFLADFRQMLREELAHQ